MSRGESKQPAFSAQSALAGQVQALLFAAADPLTLDRLVALVGGERAAVRQALAAVGAFYESPAGPGGVALQEVAGGWQLTTLPQHAALVAGLPRARLQVLSPAALETLAVIAYRQPATRAEIEAVRGVSVDGVVATLLERGLVREAGRKSAPGRPVLYATSDGFLRYFGLRSLEELPQPEQEPDGPPAG